MKVKEAMHKGVEWVGPDTPITEVAKLMCAHNIGAIPIGENDRLIGMVTDRDIVCKGLAKDSFAARRATARDVMTLRSSLDRRKLHDRRAGHARSGAGPAVRLSGAGGREPCLRQRIKLDQIGKPRGLESVADQRNDLPFSNKARMSPTDFLPDVASW
jgi:hypothetical protein